MDYDIVVVGGGTAGAGGGCGCASGKLCVKAAVLQRDQRAYSEFAQRRKGCFRY